MPFALVIIGLVMIVSGARDTYRELGAEVVEDFTGPGNFFYWMLALGALGLVGTIPNFRDFSRAFMALVIISMIIANRGFAANLSDAIAKGPDRAPENARLVGSSSTQQIDYLAFADKIADQQNERTAQNFDRFKSIVAAFI